jgi:hypothetical protein
MPTITLGTIVLYHFTRWLPGGEYVTQTRPAMVIGRIPPGGGYVGEELELDVSFSAGDRAPNGELYMRTRTRIAMYHNAPAIPTHNTWSHAGLDTEVNLLGRVL